MKQAAVALFLILFAVSIGAAQNRVPTFADYPVGTKYTGQNAKVVIDRDFQSFRTRIRLAAKEKPNFAGEYILAHWGCGAECLISVAINARTGRVYGIPLTICCWSFADDIKPIDFRLNSRLVIFSGLRNESDKDNRDDLHYYEFKNGKFRFLNTLKRSG